MVFLFSQYSSTTNYIGTYEAPTTKGSNSTVNVKKDGHAIKDVKVHTTQSTKSKSLGTLKKNQNVYIYASHNSWYQVKHGSKKGWVSKSSINFGKYVAPKPSGGKKYKDGWVRSCIKITLYRE